MVGTEPLMFMVIFTAPPRHRILFLFSAKLVNRSVFSLLRWLETWHCSHLLACCWPPCCCKYGSKGSRTSYWRIVQCAAHTHTHARLTALFPGVPRWAGTRKVKPIWILLKQQPESGSGISWAICKSASYSRQTTTPAPHLSVFYRPDALPAAQPTASKHWRQCAAIDWYCLPAELTAANLPAACQRFRAAALSLE